MRKTTVMTITVAAALTAGCSSSSEMLDSTELVCDEFATFAQDGRPADQRSDVISSIGEVIGNADQRLKDYYATLTNTVNGPANAQELADDVFAQTCFDVGWDG